MFFLFWKLEWYISFHTSCVLKNIFKKFMQFLQLMQLIYIFLIDQIVNFLLCWFYWICICIYVYIGIFQQTICCFRTVEAFCRSFKEMKKSFLVSHFTPGCGENETVPSALNKQFLQYNLSVIQLLMYVLFITKIWFTFQYNFMRYAQFFQKSYWILALSVSLCPTLR